MRKMIVAMLMAVMLMTTVASAAAPTGSGRGGFMGFIGGCCFGLRAGAAYNDGKEIHWREWVRLIPFVGLVVGIWDGIDCANGRTTSDFGSQYGAMYY
jgi:hypothetical protein